MVCVSRHRGLLLCDGKECETLKRLAERRGWPVLIRPKPGELLRRLKGTSVEVMCVHMDAPPSASPRGQASEIEQLIELAREFHRPCRIIGVTSAEPSERVEAAVRALGVSAFFYADQVQAIEAAAELVPVTGPVEARTTGRHPGTPEGDPALI